MDKTVWIKPGFSSFHFAGETQHTGTIRFDCLPDFHWDATNKQYVGIARGLRPGDPLGYAHSWFPQCASPKSKIPAAVCDTNFRTFAFMTSPDMKQWKVTSPPQPATKEHQTYTTAAFRFDLLPKAKKHSLIERTATIQLLLWGRILDVVINLP
jgi:hypothetical protein